MSRYGPVLGETPLRVALASELSTAYRAEIRHEQVAVTAAERPERGGSVVPPRRRCVTSAVLEDAAYPLGANPVTGHLGGGRHT